MQKIYVIQDYKGFFEEKWGAKPYRSGLNQQKLKTAFAKEHFKLEFIKYSEVFNQGINWQNKIVIYSSSQEVDLNYKGFIEDVIYGLKMSGARIIPDHHHLFSNNNKVFGEIVRKVQLANCNTNIDSNIYGTYEEFEVFLNKKEVDFPLIIKTSSGAGSKGVHKADTPAVAKRIAKKIMRSRNLKYELIDFLRSKRHHGYAKESKFQKKIVTQPFIKGLKNDWKVLVYGDMYYTLYREVRKNDFRASGSGLNYKSGEDSGLPLEGLDFIERIYKTLKIPCLSIDVAFDGANFYMIEYQALHFGTSTFTKSKRCYKKSNNVWEIVENNMEIEEVYAYAITKFLNE